MFFLRNKFTTIDIGQSSIKAVRMVRSKKKLKILDLKSRLLPEGTLANGKIMEPSILMGEMDNLFNKMKYKPGNIVTALPSKNLVIRNLELPGMLDEDLSEAIKWEVEEYLPFPVEDAVIDYIIVDQDQDKISVIMVAAEKKLVNNFLIPFENKNYYPKILNTQPMALLSLLKGIREDVSTTAIIDIGASGTRIVFGDRKGIYLFRSIDIGGHNFTKVIRDNSEMDLNQAEEYKKENGLTNIDKDKEKEENENEFNIDLDLYQVTAEESYNSLLISEAENLAYEISRSFNFFQRNNSDKNINNVFITGGGSKLKGLIKIIEGKLERKINPLDPFSELEDIPFKARENKELYAVAVGLGYSEIIKN